MPSRPILIRVAIALVLMATLVALADDVTQHELRQATSDMAQAPVVADAQPVDVRDDE